MANAVLDAIQDIIGRHRQVLRRERDDIAKALAENEKEKPNLESQAQADQDPHVLHELDRVVTQISRDRWRREWLDEQLDFLNNLEEEILSAAKESEIDLLARELEEIRNTRSALEDEEIPRLEEEIEKRRKEIPRLEARAVEITDRLSSLRRSGLGGDQA